MLGYEARAEMKNLIPLRNLLSEMEVDDQIINIVIEIVSYDIRRQALTSDDSKFVAYTNEHKFVERPVLKIPSVAPAFWTDKAARGRRDPFEFIKYYYGPWLKTGLSKMHLRTLDKSLYYAYWMWEKRTPPGGERLPARPPKKLPGD